MDSHLRDRVEAYIRERYAPDRQERLLLLLSEMGSEL